MAFSCEDEGPLGDDGAPGPNDERFLASASALKVEVLPTEPRGEEG